MGLGLLGRGVGDVKFLAEQGAALTVTDLKTEKELAPSLKKLRRSQSEVGVPTEASGLKPITYHLGEHRLADFRDRDFILKAAGVSLRSPFIAEAKKNKIPVLMSTALFAKFAQELGAKIIGVTGTRGKSTTTQLIYEILKTDHRRIFLGGNVRGVSTLALLPKIHAGDWVVLELDSWQLQGFGDLKISPEIAVFTNFFPDHLNYYGGDLEKYYADKANIFKYQKPGDWLVKGEEVQILPADWKLKMPGEHNRQNAALAKRAAEILGVPAPVIKKVITNFGGVPGRLELVRSPSWRRRGIKVYNDTTSTTPEALGAALGALGPTSSASGGLRGAKSIILILGGADKNLDFAGVLPLVKKYCRAVILLPGTGTDRFLASQLPSFSAFEAKTLREAVSEAKKLARRGDLILFSPGFASFGLFKNEFDRGAQFNRAILKGQ